VNAIHKRSGMSASLGLIVALSLAFIVALILTCASVRWLLDTGRQLYVVGRQVYTIAAQYYTVSALSWAHSQGVFETPQQGIIFYAGRDYCGLDKVEIEQAATNSFDGSDPHVWFVMYKIYARNHAPCDPEHPGSALYYRTFDRGGVFFLNVREGWVMMPEGKFPLFIGYWMKKLGLAGPGDPTHVPRY
jgi:hypothetical protein